MATFQYYLCPAEHCVQALQFFQIAKDDALAAKREILSKFKADAIVRRGALVDALAWKDKPIALSGFTIPRWDAGMQVWIQKPKLNTIRGKQAAAEMNDVGQLLEIWQWSLERALGVHGSVFGWYRSQRVFLYAVARGLEDGSVLLSIPVREARDGVPTSSDPGPKVPAFAREISESEAKALAPEIEQAL